MSLLTIVLVVLVVAAAGGGFWGPATWGPRQRWSPLAIVLVVLLILWLTGNLHAGGLRIGR